MILGDPASADIHRLRVLVEMSRRSEPATATTSLENYLVAQEMQLYRSPGYVLRKLESLLRTLHLRCSLMAVRKQGPADTRAERPFLWCTTRP